MKNQMTDKGGTIVRWTYGTLAVLLLLLVEDWALWSVPTIIDSASHPLLQLECSEVKPGQSREQALKIMHRWTTPTAEATDKPELGIGFIVELGRDGGYDSCTVQFDAATGTVKAAKYHQERYGEFPPVIE